MGIIKTDRRRPVIQCQSTTTSNDYTIKMQCVCLLCILLFIAGLIVAIILLATIGIDNEEDKHKAKFVKTEFFITNLQENQYSCAIKKNCQCVDQTRISRRHILQ